MNSDQLKGALQNAGGHIEESAGALVGDENLKLAGQEDQIKGEARKAWGNVKEAGDNLIDQAKAAKTDAEIKSARVQAFESEHRVEVEGLDKIGQKPDENANRKEPEKSGEPSSSQAGQKSA